MKKYILISLCLLTAAGSFAQNKDFKFKFYGQIRTDFYYSKHPIKYTLYFHKIENSISTLVKS